MAEIPNVVIGAVADVMAASTLLRMSEYELECKLANARIAGSTDDSKTGAWSGTARSWYACATGARARCHELSVIEYIKKLSAELEAYTVRYGEFFHERKIPVVDTWTVKKTPP